eukprot:TRINITY_DN3420_c0_g1_i4.p1 TRINITY_DN3420_c0_g1~~TRINITY_DN3420_c0_g1_i4.p1  ORF type:complete len:282 (+),score=39.98 TRINITY_DN3420_c0_g1_i4:3-848(+)
MQRTYIFFFFQAEDGIRDHAQSRGLGDVYKRQSLNFSSAECHSQSKRLSPFMKRNGNDKIPCARESLRQSNSDTLKTPVESQGNEEEIRSQCTSGFLAMVVIFALSPNHLGDGDFGGHLCLGGNNSLEGLLHEVLIFSGVNRNQGMGVMGQALRVSVFMMLMLMIGVVIVRVIMSVMSLIMMMMVRAMIMVILNTDTARVLEQWLLLRITVTAIFVGNSLLHYLVFGLLVRRTVLNDSSYGDCLRRNQRASNGLQQLRSCISILRIDFLGLAAKCPWSSCV